MKILLVAGARPNFMKIAPILREMAANPHIEPVLVHTGQHYDANMSETFFNDLGIPLPNYHLNCGGGSHAEQTAKIMMKFEPLCISEKPDVLLVVGDVNSTIATGLVAKKLHIKLAHVEAGLRSGDRSMPEEINRLATDAITDVFFTTEESGSKNLAREGHPESSIRFVGHVMIDNLFYQVSEMSNRKINDSVLRLKEELPEKYFCLTLHRPSNVDDAMTLEILLKGIQQISEVAPIVFPCHPRTKKRILDFGLETLLNSSGESDKRIIITEPLGYNDFLYLWKDSAGVITDSGGLQEETTALGIPCLTLRENTERPVTVDIGTNTLIGKSIDLLDEKVEEILSGNYKKGQTPELWDGKAAKRIVQVLMES